MEAPLAPDEQERLAVLRRCGILDTIPEAHFDEVAELASAICETPIALVSLVDVERQWFKASVGLDVTETPRSAAICAHAILQRDLFMVEDTTADPRFRDNPLVTGAPYVRFYAGAPFESSEGHALGTLCVLDRVPRKLTSLQKNALRVLGKQVEAQLEFRRLLSDFAAREDALRELQRKGDDLRAFLVHDLKNALAVLAPNAEYLGDAGLTGEYAEALADLREGVGRMHAMVVQHLDRGRPMHDLTASVKPLDLCAFLEDIAQSTRRRFDAYGQKIVVAIPDAPVVVKADPSLLGRVLANLLDNAAKYAGTACVVTLSVHTDDAQRCLLTVTDNGPGIPIDQRHRVFETRVRLTEVGAQGHGLGLAFCRSAVEAFGGTIRIVDAVTRGAGFEISLPTS